MLNPEKHEEDKRVEKYIDGEFYDEEEEVKELADYIVKQEKEDREDPHRLTKDLIKCGLNPEQQVSFISKMRNFIEDCVKQLVEKDGNVSKEVRATMNTLILTFNRHYFHTLANIGLYAYYERTPKPRGKRAWTIEINSARSQERHLKSFA